MMENVTTEDLYRQATEQTHRALLTRCFRRIEFLESQLKEPIEEAKLASPSDSPSANPISKINTYWVFLGFWMIGQKMSWEEVEWKYHELETRHRICVEYLEGLEKLQQATKASTSSLGKLSSKDIEAQQAIEGEVKFWGGLERVLEEAKREYRDLLALEPPSSIKEGSASAIDAETFDETPAMQYEGTLDIALTKVTLDSRIIGGDRARGDQCGSVSLDRDLGCVHRVDEL